MDEGGPLEALEVRIDLLRQDSRLTSHRIAALEDRRKEIQLQIKALKTLARQTRENEEAQETDAQESN